MLAWLASLAAQLGVDLDDAASRYADGCPRCGATPCSCPTPDVPAARNRRAPAGPYGPGGALRSCGQASAEDVEPVGQRCPAEQGAQQHRRVGERREHGHGDGGGGRRHRRWLAGRQLQVDGVGAQLDRPGGEVVVEAQRPKGVTTTRSSAAPATTAIARSTRAATSGTGRGGRGRRCGRGRPHPRGCWASPSPRGSRRRRRAAACRDRRPRRGTSRSCRTTPGRRGPPVLRVVHTPSAPGASHWSAPTARTASRNACAAAPNAARTSDCSGPWSITSASLSCCRNVARIGRPPSLAW